jgi:hypothetical protein
MTSSTTFAFAAGTPFLAGETLRARSTTDYGSSPSI